MRDEGGGSREPKGENHPWSISHPKARTYIALGCRTHRCGWVVYGKVRGIVGHIVFTGIESSRRIVKAKERRKGVYSPSPLDHGGGQDKTGAVEEMSEN